MVEERIRDKKPDLVSILPYSLEQLREDARGASSSGKITGQQLHGLDKILEEFEHTRSETEQSTIHDLIKHTVHTENPKDEFILEQILYAVYDLGIPSMWGPVLEE